MIVVASKQAIAGVLTIIVGSISSVWAASQPQVDDFQNLINTVGIPWACLFIGAFFLYRAAKAIFNTAWPTMRSYLEAQADASHEAKKVLQVVPGLLKEQTEAIQTQLSLIQELHKRHDDHSSPLSSIPLERAVDRALDAFEDTLEGEKYSRARDFLKEAKGELRKR